MASTDAVPVPRKNTAYRITFPILDADGDPVTGAAGLDSEVSKDAGTFADCTNEATEIATSSGIYYLDLTSTEMNADTVAIRVQTSTTGAKTTVIVLYPEEAGDIRVNAAQVGGTTQTAYDIGGNLGALNASASSGDPGTTTTLVQYLKQLVNTLEGTAGIPTYPAAAVAANAVSLAEVIRSIDSRLPAALGANSNLKVDLRDINGTTIAGTGSQVASAFVSFFNVASPALTVGSVNQTGDSYARIGLNGAGLTALGDTRLANLDAAVSTRSSHTAADVWAVTGRTLSSFSFEVTLAASQPNYAPSKAGDAMTLTPSERTATANEVEAQIIDDTDSEKVLTAITDKIAAANPSLAGLTLSAIAAAVRDVANTSPAANSLGAAVKASADRMPGSGTLATTADVPTVSAITTQITTDHGIGSYERNTEPVDVSTNVAAIKARTDNLPSDPADASDVAAAFSTVNSTLATIAGYIDTEIAAIKAKTDNLPPSPAAVGSAMTLADGAITSAKIADGAITSAKFTVSAITGVASGILEKIDQIWRRFFKQVTKSSTQIKTYADDGTTVLTTQSATESGSDQTLGEAS
jgi:hypothetical protein